MLFQVLQAVGLDSAAAEMAEDMAQGAAPVADLAPQQVEQSFSLIEMATKGGWLMIVLAILSVIAIYIFGKKWWMIHKAGQVDKNFMRDIRDYIHEGKVKSAVSLCQKYDSPVARLVEKESSASEGLWLTSRLPLRTWATSRSRGLRRGSLCSPPSQVERR